MKKTLISRVFPGSIQALLCALTVAACGGSMNPVEDNGQVSGELAVLAADSFLDADETMVSNRLLYSLVDESGESFELIFNQPLDGAATGDRISVRGIREGSQIQVQSYHLTPTHIASQTQSIIDPKPLDPIGILAIVYDSEYDTDKAKQRLDADPDGARRYYLYTSYGTWTLGPIDAVKVEVKTTGCDPLPIAKEGKAAAKAAGIDISKFKLFAHYLPKSAGCSWGGLALMGKSPLVPGSRGQPAPDTWYAASFACVVLNQELGHNFGLRHTHYCTGGGAKSIPAQGCSGFAEYGDPFTVVSSGCGHLHDSQMGLMGFLDKCNIVDAGTGTYEIGPITQMCNGPQVLRVDEGNGAGYSIEYRKPHGGVFSKIDPKEGVLFHYGSLDLKKADPNTFFLVNPTGGKNRDALMPAGTEFTTPGGNVFKVVSFDGGKAKIEITAKSGAGAKCADGSEFSAVVTCKEYTEGNAGTGGTAGAGGSGGSSVGGSGGVGGNGGSPPVSGNGGGGNTTRGGSSGVAGTGNLGGTTNSGGGPSGGAAGTHGGAGGGDGGTPPGDDTPPDGGCGCSIPGRATSSSLAGLAVVTAFGLARLRRRRS